GLVEAWQLLGAEARLEAACLGAEGIGDAEALAGDEIAREGARDAHEARAFGPAGHIAPPDALAEGDSQDRSGRGRGRHRGFDLEGGADEIKPGMQGGGFFEHAPLDIEDALPLAARLHAGDLDVGGVKSEKDGGVDMNELIPAALRSVIEELALDRDDG